MSAIATHQSAFTSEQECVDKRGKVAMMINVRLKQSSTRNCSTTNRMTVGFGIIRPEELF